jgi:heme/copper-type cytochrome/quinol oxidase subunit 2
MNRRHRARRFAVAGILAAAALVAVPAARAGEASDDPPAADAPAEPQDGIPEKRIKLYAENWKWTPRTIRVPLGSRLILEIENFEGPHTFELEAYRLNVALPQGKKTVVDFVVDRPGTFRWRCGRPCGNGCPKMTGKLIVEEPQAGS